MSLQLCLDCFALGFLLMLLALAVRGGVFLKGPPPKGTRWALYSHHLGTYMRRWIWKTPWGTLRLHNILRSDDDRHLHDHPFDFTSFLLSGGYTEETQGEQHWTAGILVADVRVRRWWPRFSIVRKRAEDAHRLILDRPLWTFVVSGLKRRAWGFHTEKGWIVHTRYLDLFPEEAASTSHADLVRMRKLDGVKPHAGIVDELNARATRLARSPRSTASSATCSSSHPTSRTGRNSPTRSTS
jgi:hypothetical protein